MRMLPIRWLMRRKLAPTTPWFVFSCNSPCTLITLFSAAHNRPCAEPFVWGSQIDSLLRMILTQSSLFLLLRRFRFAWSTLLVVGVFLPPASRLIWLCQSASCDLSLFKLRERSVIRSWSIPNSSWLEPKISAISSDADLAIFLRDASYFVFS